MKKKFLVGLLSCLLISNIIYAEEKDPNKADTWWNTDVIEDTNADQGIYDDNGNGDKKPSQKTSYYRLNEKEGWFWYQKDKKPEAQRNSTETVSIPKKEPTYKEQEKPLYDKNFSGFAIKWNEVWKMHPKEFNKLIEKTLDWAIEDAGNAKKVKVYYALQWVAKERSKQFMDTWEYVRTQNPILDDTTYSDPSRAGHFMRATEIDTDKHKIMDKAKEKMGLILFTTSKYCPYCLRSEDIMKKFVVANNWKNYLTINIDNRPDLIEKYNIQIVPDLWVVGDIDGKPMTERLRAGLLTWGDVNEGLIQAYSRMFTGKGYMDPVQAQPLQTFDDIVKKMEQEGFQGTLKVDDFKNTYQGNSLSQGQ